MTLRDEAVGKPQRLTGALQPRHHIALAHVGRKIKVAAKNGINRHAADAIAASENLSNDLDELTARHSTV